MTNEDILKQAIKKAKENGWETNWILPEGDTIYSVIFSHSFAKAFWGEGETEYKTYSMEKEYLYFQIAWQYHLQRMVLEKEPLKYLAKYL